MAVDWTEYHHVRSATPAYVQLADFIEAAIRDGRLQPGDQLPAERTLRDLTGHSTETAARTRRLLVERGLVESGVGTGTFVRTLT